MKNLKRFLAYFVYILFIGYLLVLANMMTYQYRHQYQYGLMIFILMSLLPFFIGLLLALPQLIVAMHKPGVWTFDWVKFIAVGVPSLLAAGAMSIFWPVPFLHHYMSFLYGNSILSTTGGIVFGYVLLNSFEKVSRTNSALSESNDGVLLQ